MPVCFDIPLEGEPKTFPDVMLSCAEETGFSDIAK